jgi:ABC-type multidrug transport system ATPase subunit
MLTAPQILLAARGVSRRFGQRLALAPTDLEVRGGEALALIGPNGAGKSTLISILAGALSPSEGSVVERDGGLRIGWVPQSPALYGRLSPRENLELFARLEDVDDPRAMARELLSTVELPAGDVQAATLSVGNRQRLNLAIALLGSPDVLLLDEPTASLDPRQRRRLWALSEDVTARGGAVVFATQNLDELERLASRVAVLLDGRLIFEGTLDEYRATPAADVFAG